MANLDARSRFREQLALIAWPDLAGEHIRAHTQAEAVRDGVLLVAADTPAWAQELHMRRGELLARLAAQIGPGVIREIHFRSGSLARSSRAQRPRRPRPADIKLSGRQQRTISEAAAHIEDPDLRGRAERAFLALARMAEWRKRTGWRRCRRCGQWQHVGRRWCASCARAGEARR